MNTQSRAKTPKRQFFQEKTLFWNLRLEITIKTQRISKWISLQGLNWDLILDHAAFSFSTVWGSSKRSCEITGLFDDFVARFSSLISELHSLRPPLRPPLKGTPAFAPDSAHYAPTFATKICLKIIKNPGSHNFFWNPQCWKIDLIYKIPVLEWSGSNI